MPTDAPSRSTMKLTLTIGVIPLALDVFSAVEESAVKRATYVRDGDVLHKGGLIPYDTVTGKTVTRDQLLLCIETPEGDLVEVTDDELQQLLVSENGICKFIGFIPVEQFNYSTEKPYQVRPQKVKTKVNPYEKPFALVMESMQRTSTIALLSFVSRGKTRYAAIASDGSMCTLRFDEEVRAQRPMPSVELGKQELDLGKLLVEKLTLGVPPVLHDEDSATVMDYALRKAKTQAAGETIVIAPPADAPAGGGDLMALLSASVGT